jgi:thiol-disulfide isomerase/thioredoxin
MRLRYVFIIFFAQNVFSQRSLSIGDRVPDIEFGQVLNYSSNAARLSDFDGKLVLLDFWATWCTSCLHSFPRLDSLQQQMKDKLQIILVNCRDTKDNLSTVESFFKKWESRMGWKLQLMSVVDDTVANKIFEHHLIPHYVWISKEGKLIAISSSYAITAENINAALNGTPLEFTMKKDQDADRPIFSSEDLPITNLLNYSILVKGWFDGLPSGDRIREKDGVICGKAMTNLSIIDMYRTIVRGMDPAMNQRQIIAEVASLSSLVAPADGDRREDWYKDHAYTMDIIVPIEQANRLYKRMLETLNHYSGYTGRFEKRKMKCWVLEKISTGIIVKLKADKTRKEEDVYLKNITARMLVEKLNDLPAIREPVIDETGYTGNANVEFPDGLNNIKIIQSQLRKQGLILMKEERVVKLFIITRQPAPHNSY